MKKRKMLIIGHVNPKVKCLQWDELNHENASEISDFQILILNCDTYPNEQLIPQIHKILQSNLIKLINNYHYVIVFFPTTSDNSFNNFFPFGVSLVLKKGSSLTFKDDPVINVIKPFLKNHEVVLSNLDPQYAIGKTTQKTSELIVNNVKEVCGFRIANSYFLHAPTKSLFLRAIEKLVDYFQPELAIEQFEKPDWVNEYELNQLGIKEISESIQGIDKQIKDLKVKKSTLESKVEQTSKWSDLLYTQGTTLELRLKEAFELLGVKNVEHEPNGSHGPDLIIVHNGFAFTVEVEGSKGPIRVDKARQLLHWIAEAPADHKGLLIGNPFREIQPEKRPPENQLLFVKEAVQLAEKSNLAFITSYEIFKLVSQFLKKNKPDIRKLLQTLNDISGVYSP